MAVNYGSYLKIDQLLNLQEPRSSPEEHDELLFVIIHQVYELWFKQLLHEFDKITADLSGNRLFDALFSLKRVRMIVKTLVAQLDILETMTPLSFSAFRDRLDTASGFQSMQFREVEFLLGYKRPDVLRYIDPSWIGHDKVQRRLEEPSLVDHFREFLTHHGVEAPARPPATQSTQPDPASHAALLELYRTRPEMALLFEQMMDVDEGLQEWRYRHVKVVERTIGSKRGTGGSPGVDFLKQSLFNPVFPDLWAIRHMM
jgi:tryptophan 2,3-dioxygenase